MQALTIFLFKSALCSGLLLAWYWLALRNRKLHNYNRYYLLSVVAISLALPCMHFEWYSIQQPATPVAIKLLQAINAGDAEEIAGGKAAFSFTTEYVAYCVYGLVCVSLLALTVYRIAQINMIKKPGKVQRMNGFDLVITTDNKAPFSFMNTLYWRDTMDMESTSGQQVLRHEMAHLKQHHSIDKLLLQAVVILFWINPFYWLLQKELSQVHEFIADEAAIDNNDTDAFARMLLQAHFGNIATYIINPFFYSSVKRRIIMLNKTNKTKYAGYRKLLILPLLPAMACLFSFSIKRSAPINRPNYKVVMVLDAGHGGNDMGVASTNGRTEKDINRAICKKIASLAGAYNIGVVLTHEDDETLTLEERVSRANAVKANLFVSIHVNKVSAEEPAVHPYEVIVSEKNAKIRESKLLASAVIAGMQADGVQPVLVSKGLHVLKGNNAPAILIECGDVDNAIQMAMLQNDDKLTTFCRGILNGIATYEQTTTK